MKIESGELPEVTSWTSASKGAIGSREAFFRALLRKIKVPAATVSELDASSNDPKRRNVVIKVDYRGQFLENLPESLSAFVQIEVGSARVNPGEPRPLSSWIHTFVHQSAPQVAAECTDNRVTLHCLYPSVTLLEKIEAISRCFGQEKPAASIVRHYEDAAKILQQSKETIDELKKLLQSLLDDSDIERWPSPTHPAFLYDPAAVRWIQLEGAWQAIAPKYWGERVELFRCSELIRELLERLAE